LGIPAKQFTLSKREQPGFIISKMELILLKRSFLRTALLQEWKVYLQENQAARQYRFWMMQKLLLLTPTSFFKLYDDFAEIERLFRKIFEAAYVETVNRIEGIQFHTAEERYKALISEAPNVIQRIPLKYVASYLGITQVSLSRIRGMH
jgi:hypothetical protein